jgi:hypothetical protein
METDITLEPILQINQRPRILSLMFEESSKETHRSIIFNFGFSLFLQRSECFD